MNRVTLVRRGLRLEYLTFGWNIVEGVIAVTAAVAAGSVALLGFGIDSFVESASAAVLIWRLRAEQGTSDAQAVEALEHRAGKLVGLSFFGLSLYIWIDSVLTLWTKERPDASPVGIAVTSLSVGVMWWLAREKRQTARALGSRSLEADSAQTQACWWLSLIVLAGIALNAAFGWWWADPVAALGMTYFLVREGLEAWRGDDH